MLIRRFFRQLREGFVGVGRHIGMAFSSASAVTITLLLVGAFMILVANLAVLTQDIENSISLSALVDYEVQTQHELNDIERALSQIEGVDKVTFRSKDEEFDYYVSQYSDEEVVRFYELYREDNPFHDVFLVTSKDPAAIANIKVQVAKVAGIDSVYDGGSNTYVLVNILNNIRVFGGILVLSLVVLATYLIYNTIKITIVSRDDEIKIMKNVGAKNSYIRGPFLIEGIIIGIMGSIVPIGGLVYGYYYLLNVTGGILLGVVTLIDFQPFVYYLSSILLALGVLVGYLGSFISVSKSLRHRR